LGVVRIDLHTHSTASDGTDSPSDLVRAAAASGLDVVALTDHDSTYGWEEAVAARPAGLTLVPGAELSCAYGGISLHVLAYLFDPAHPRLTAELERSRDDRLPRAREMVRRLAADGYPITWADVSGQVGRAGATVGRPHIADALVAAGAVPDRERAFAEVLHSRSRYYVGHYAVDALQAVRLVVEAGGVAVFAHPLASRRGRVVSADVIAAMTGAGLAGVEVDHRDHDEADRARLRGLAADLGLVPTGSSDYHGGGKPNRLGENTTDPDAYAALVARAAGGCGPVGP
jgi:3',5'-nucleoside bisphosphate phosphatase